MTRTDVKFQSGGVHCAAWLYRPEGVAAGRSLPIVVMAHGLAGVKEERLDAFAERFTEAGYLCLVFDYRYFGDSDGQPRQLLSTAAQREDWRAAVTYARTIEGADPDRVVVWGTSYSGGHVLVIAAEDRRIAAALAQCPFTDGLASTLRIPPLTSLRLTALAVADVIGAKFGRRPIMVESTGKPGETALMTSPDALAGYSRLKPPGKAIRKDVAARFALDIIHQFPGRRAKDIRCPLFVAVCLPDSVAPAGPTRRYVAKAPNVEVALHDAGHFDIYVGDDFERNVTDQLEFLRRTVPAS